MLRSRALKKVSPALALLPWSPTVTVPRAAEYAPKLVAVRVRLEAKCLPAFTVIILTVVFSLR